MGSPRSDGFDPGSIVWVRRRNGSWWPGKILEPEELSASHLMSPRSGTPVKLLGREDASVDWYNLEKSKRVKAFRCGEFNDCIERAESSQGMPIKKREKYARREDAILHALELEKRLLKKQGKLGIASDNACSKSSLAVRVELATSPENDEGKTVNCRMLKGQEMSHNDEIYGIPLNSDKAEEDGNQPSFEDITSEAVPRMRGLQDFGIRTAPSKRKLSSSEVVNSSHKPVLEENCEVPLHGGLTVDDSIHLNGTEQVGIICQRKRSKCVYLPAEFGDSSNCKEVSPSQEDMASLHSIDGNGHPHPGLFLEDGSFGFADDVESGSSETDSSVPDSDSSETEPDMHEDIAVLSVADPWAMGRPEALRHGNMSGEEHDDSAHSDRDPPSGNEAVSKWQLKGKRNVRHLPKRSVDANDAKAFNRSIYGTYSEVKEHGSFGQSLNFHRNGETDFDMAYLDEEDVENEMAGLENGGYSLGSKYASNRRRSGMTSWEDLGWEDSSPIEEYWEDRRNCLEHIYGRHSFSGRARSILIDVDLKVQASYQKVSVPIVSLMSKVNGQAIIGHPIQIEAVEDGSSETLLSTNEDLGDKAFGNDGTTALQPTWRTARRSAKFRVPRPQLSSALDGDEAGDYLPFPDKARPPSKKMNAEGLGHNANLMKKSLRPPTSRKFQRKSPKKVSLSSSQKTRTLSSFAIEQNLRKVMHNHSSNGQVNRLIKTESSGLTTVACIPIKLVFSRLLEKINRPPSKAFSNAAPTVSDCIN